MTDPDVDPVALALLRSEGHLKAIRSYLGWLLVIVLVGIVAGVVLAVQAAQETSGGL